ERISRFANKNDLVSRDSGAPFRLTRSDPGVPSPRARAGGGLLSPSDLSCPASQDASPEKTFLQLWKRIDHDPFPLESPRAEGWAGSSVAPRRPLTPIDTAVSSLPPPFKNT